MVVCHCKGISDRHVRRAVREGASSRGQVARSCGAGTVCGGCVPAIDEIVQGEIEAQMESLFDSIEFAPAR